MKGDFTRNTADVTRHYSGVRMQQGRVQIDADWNEQVDIETHLDRTTRIDTIGEVGTPLTDLETWVATGFEIVVNGGGNLTVGEGRIYVDGWLCEGEETTSVLSPLSGETGQPDMPPQNTTFTPTDGHYYIVYLDVWQRHLTWLDDENIKEAALNGPDHGTRTRTVWQVRLLDLGTSATAPECSDSPDAWEALTTPGRGRLAARAEPPATVDDPCDVAPNAGYRGPENQLYRVEIHKGGAAGTATFKWSRENGSVVAAVQAWDTTDATIEVSSGGPDTVLRFAGDQWVELYGDDVVLATPRPGDGDEKTWLGAFMRLAAAEGDELTLTTSTAMGSDTIPSDLADLGTNPQVRRWDGDSGLTAVPSDPLEWVDLEDGVQVRFSSADGEFRAGDYWLIPARVTSADVEWAEDDAGDPVLEEPEGIEHAYARLAIAQYSSTSGWTVTSDCRPEFPPLTLIPELYALAYLGGDGQSYTPGVQLRSFVAGVFLGHRGLSGVGVTFTVDTAGAPGVLSATQGTAGTLSTLTVNTDSNGLAKVWLTVNDWTLPAARVTATLEGETAPYTQSVEYRAYRQVWLEVYSGDAQTGTPGNFLDQVVTFIVRDRDDGVVNNARVHIVVTGGGALFQPDHTTALLDGSGNVSTGTTGKIQAHWALGGNPADPQVLTATLIDEGNTPIGQGVTARADFEITGLILQGDAQHVPANTATLTAAPQPLLLMAMRQGRPVITDRTGAFYAFTVTVDTGKSNTLEAKVDAGSGPALSVTAPVNSGTGMATVSLSVRGAAGQRAWFQIDAKTPGGQLIAPTRWVHVDLVQGGAAFAREMESVAFTGNPTVTGLLTGADSVVPLRLLAPGIIARFNMAAPNENLGYPRMDLYVEAPMRSPGEMTDGSASASPFGYVRVRIPSQHAEGATTPAGDSNALEWRPHQGPTALVAQIRSLYRNRGASPHYRAGVRAYLVVRGDLRFRMKGTPPVPTERIGDVEIPFYIQVEGDPNPETFTLVPEP